MTDPHDELETRIQAYASGDMSAEEQADFEELLASDSELAVQVEAQQALELRLRQSFSTQEKSVSDIETWLSEAEEDASTDSSEQSQPTIATVEDSQVTQARRRTQRVPVSRRSLGIAAVVAASAALVLLLVQWGKDSKQQPFFQPQELAQIYHETIDHGFKPYYNCEDDERFAKTFRDRQQVALRLKPTANGRMIGLSYPGGLSRLTTAMLCLVQEQPVMVFVDRKDVDNESLAASTEEGLFVHRTELGELVLYEVSPFEVPKMMDALEVL